MFFLLFEPGQHISHAYGVFSRDDLVKELFALQIAELRHDVLESQVFSFLSELEIEIRVQNRGFDLVQRGEKGVQKGLESALVIIRQMTAETPVHSENQDFQLSFTHIVFIRSLDNPLVSLIFQHELNKLYELLSILLKIKTLPVRNRKWVI